MNFIKPALNKLKRLVATPAMATLITVSALTASNNLFSQNKIKMTVKQDVNDLDRIAKLLAEHLEAQIPEDQSEEFSLDLDLKTVLDADDIKLLADMSSEEVDAFLETVKENFSEGVRERITLDDDFKKIIQNTSLVQSTPAGDPSPAKRFVKQGRVPEAIGATDRALDNPKDKIGGYTFAELWRAEAIANGVENPDIAYAYKGLDENIEAGKRHSITNCTLDCLKGVKDNGVYVYKYAATFQTFGQKLSDAVKKGKGPVQFGDITVYLDDADKDAQNEAFFNHVFDKDDAFFRRAEEENNMLLVEEAFDESGVVYEGLSVETGVFQGSLGTKLSDMAFGDMEGPEFLALIKSYAGNRIRDLLHKVATTGDMSLVNDPLLETMPNLTACRDQISAIVSAHMAPFNEFRPDLTEDQAEQEITLADVIQIYAIRHLAETNPQALEEYVLEMNVDPKVADCIESIINIYAASVMIQKQEITFANALEIGARTEATTFDRSFSNFANLGSTLYENAQTSIKSYEVTLSGSLALDNREKNVAKRGFDFSRFNINAELFGGVSTVKNTGVPAQFNTIAVGDNQGFTDFNVTMPSFGGRIGFDLWAFEGFAGLRGLLNKGHGANVDNFFKKGMTANGVVGAKLKAFGYDFNNGNGFVNLSLGAQMMFNDIFGPKAGDDDADKSTLANLLVRPVLSNADQALIEDYFVRGQGTFESTNGHQLFVELRAQIKNWTIFASAYTQQTSLQSEIDAALAPFTDDGGSSPLAIPKPRVVNGFNFGIKKNFNYVNKDELRLAKHKLKMMNAQTGEILLEETSDLEVSRKSSKPKKLKSSSRGSLPLIRVNKQDVKKTERDSLQLQDMEKQIDAELNKLEKKAGKKVGALQDVRTLLKNQSDHNRDFAKAVANENRSWAIMSDAHKQAEIDRILREHGIEPTREMNVA